MKHSKIKTPKDNRTNTKIIKQNKIEEEKKNIEMIQQRKKKNY